MKSDNVRSFEPRKPSELSPDDLETLRQGLAGAAAYEHLKDTLSGILERRILPTRDLWDELRDTTVGGPDEFTPKECDELAVLLARWNQQLTYAGITEDDDGVTPHAVLVLYEDLYRGTSHYQRSEEAFRQEALRR
jgi:hypothetical protein